MSFCLSGCKLQVFQDVNLCVICTSVFCSCFKKSVVIPINSWNHRKLYNVGCQLLCLPFCLNSISSTARPLANIYMWGKNFSSWYIFLCHWVCYMYRVGEWYKRIVLSVAKMWQFDKILYFHVGIKAAEKVIPIQEFQVSSVKKGSCLFS